MKATRRMEITMETQETTVIRFGQNRTTAFCAGCQTHTPHLSVVEAVSIRSFSASAVCRLAQDKQIHSMKDSDGALMICGNSLALVKE